MPGWRLPEAAGSVCLPGIWFSAAHSRAGPQHRPFVPRRGRARRLREEGREARGSWLAVRFLPRSHRSSHRLGAKRPLPCSVCPGPSSSGEGGRGARGLSPGLAEAESSPQEGVFIRKLELAFGRRLCRARRRGLPSGLSLQASQGPLWGCCYF